MALSPETLEWIKNYQPSAGAAAPVAEDKGITDHILWTLGLLSRPSKAVWTGVDEGLKDDGNIWEGVKKGWYDRPGSKELADVVGLPEGQATDDWAPWLGKEAARLVTSAVGDPLSYAFAPAKAKGLVGPAIKALGVPEGKSIAGVTAKALGSDRLAEGFYGSKIGKVLKSGLPKTPKYEPHMQKWWEIEREGSKIPIEELAQVARKSLNETGLADDLVFNAAERTAQASPELQQAAELLKPLRGTDDRLFGEWNDLLESIGKERVAPAGDEFTSYMPRVPDPTQARRAVGRRYGDIDLAKDAMRQAGREIYRWTDEVGNPLLDAAGNPIIGDITHPSTKKAVEAALQPGQTAIPKQAALSEVQPLTQRSFVSDPVEALRQASESRQAKVNTLKLMKHLKENDLLEQLPQYGPLREGWRALAVPGFETWQTSPQIANWLENMAGVPTDWLGKSLQKARQTPIGQTLEAATQWTKRNMLAPSAAYWTGNLVSDTLNRYASGQNPIDLGRRMYQASRTLGGADPTMLREMQIRGLPVSSWAGSLAEESKNLPPSRLRDVAEDIPGLNKIMDGLGYVSEHWRDANNWLFEKGNKYTEAPARMATALDYIAKNAPDPKAPTPEMLDRAAAFAKEALVDYGSGGMTATQRELQRLLIPFAGWQFGMPTLFAQQLAKNPQRLGRVGRALDTAFMPLTDQDRAVADPYLHENAPIRGVAGWEFPRDDKGIPQIMQLQRYLPWGNIEGMANRLPSNVWSSVNPWLKAPLELGLNYSVFSGQPIDRSAKGFGALLENPVTSGPYSKSRQEYFGQPIPAGYEYLLNQSPLGRNVSTANDMLRSLGLWQDPYKAPTTPVSQLATLVTDGKFTQFDREKQRMHRKAEYSETEKAIKANMKFALNKMDMEGYKLYLNQYLDHVSKKSQKLGYSTPGA